MIGTRIQGQQPEGFATVVEELSSAAASVEGGLPGAEGELSSAEGGLSSTAAGLEDGLSRASTIKSLSNHSRTFYRRGGPEQTKEIRQENGNLGSNSIFEKK
ncbi:hypothetical protein Daus18300_007553 [Diaporthe australafricana]|uniref:Uncharacterized protein n=1 Tax=Diaporthe australafricana TaxID=127596 RepID=A0ABR3WM72_9PEZI